MRSRKPIRRLPRRRPPRRRKGPRQGALLFPPRRFRPMGSEKSAPELWNIFNGRKHHGEHFRVFPLSNWTEMDVWQYIKAEKIPLPEPLLHPRARRLHRSGSCWPSGIRHSLGDGEEPVKKHGPLPHHRRCDLHRSGGIRRLDAGRDHSGSRHRPPDRARHPRRRQTVRDRHGRPQEGRLFLSARGRVF
jgi:3'-phosphoadenosine 5'-phosphosulfate sulfotransferase (PAPS reductase)/FAD synthetase